MQAANPQYREVVERGFARSAFLAHLGVAMVDCGPGWCEAGFDIRPHHLQHTGVVHAGAVSTLADHGAGAAAMTLMAAGQVVLTAEFKINLLRPARGERLECRAQVLKPGRTLMVVESEIWALQGGQRSLCAKFSGTMAVIAGSF